MANAWFWPLVYRSGFEQYHTQAQEVANRRTILVIWSSKFGTQTVAERSTRAACSVVT